MSKIKGFKMGKGITVEDKDKHTWSRRYLELEIETPGDFSQESIQKAFTRAENILDFWLDQMGPSQIPGLDIADIDALPWKAKEGQPSQPGHWGWILGPKSAHGITPGADILVAALEKAADQKLQLGDMEYSFSKNKAFINRKPVKQESAA